MARRRRRGGGGRGEGGRGREDRGRGDGGRGGGGRARPSRDAGGNVVALVIGAVVLISTAAFVLIAVKNKSDERKRRRVRDAREEREKKQKAEQEREQQERQARAQTAQVKPASAPRSGSGPGRPGPSAASRPSAPAGSARPIHELSATQTSRRLNWRCSNCKNNFYGKDTKCDQCKKTVLWPGSISCPFDAPGKKGICGFCKGTGKNPHYQPQSRLPFGMSRGGTTKEGCPECRGSKTCTHCRGSGTYAIPGNL